MATHALFESASGYAVFEVKLADGIASKTQALQESIKDLSKFGKMVTLMSFSPFKSAADALENINDVSENVVSEHLRNVLELNLSKSSKKSSIKLAVHDSQFGSAIKASLGISCDASDLSQEILRGIRLHATKLLKGLQGDDLNKAQLGLGHAYSRAKLKFNVNRIDNMIIQAIALLDQLDKDVNLFSMRIREWYGYHFPELVKLVPDNHQYARVAQFIRDKESLDESKLPELAIILEDDSTLAQNILDAARGSMGSALAEIDMLNISAFATRVVSLGEYRKSLISYLSEKMNLVAPSLTALLGERIDFMWFPDYIEDNGTRRSAKSYNYSHPQAQLVLNINQPPPQVFFWRHPSNLSITLEEEYSEFVDGLLTVPLVSHRKTLKTIWVDAEINYGQQGAVTLKLRE
ncbi:NOSIC-domain-containing protein [Pluteus cervinus]|uniref:NOSIC-domain-containing protein n=1 Tax=Pluteus cervinus TaxID=181527 RepID=A0ACD3B0W3_9AGAR|nr:NOSIC-domain-containing protein [Pluteus cervinus]